MIGRDHVRRRTDAAALGSIIQSHGNVLAQNDFRAIQLVGVRSGRIIRLVRAGRGLIQSVGLALVVGLALLSEIGARLSDRRLDLVRILRNELQVARYRILLREHAALEVVLAGADTAGLDQEGQAVIQTEVAAADRRVRRPAIVVHTDRVIAFAHVRSLLRLKRGGRHPQRKSSDSRIVVQAGGGRRLDIVRIVHALLAGIVAVVGELMRVENDLRHEQAPRRVQLRKLGSLQGGMVAVHVVAVVSGAREQIRAVRIDARHHDHVDLIQHRPVLAVIDEVVNHDQRAFARSRLIRMDLGLIPDVHLAVRRHRRGSLFQSGSLGDRRRGDEHHRQVEIVVRRLARGIQIHVAAVCGAILHERHHLFLRGELVLGMLAVESGGLIALRRDLEVLEHLIGPVHQVAVAVVLHVAVGRERRLIAGLIALAGALAALEDDVLLAVVDIRLRDVEELQDGVVVTVALAVHAVAVDTGLLGHRVAGEADVFGDQRQRAVPQHGRKSGAGGRRDALVQVDLGGDVLAVGFLGELERQLGLFLLLDQVARIVDGVTIKREVHGLLVIGEQAVLEQRAVIAGAVANVGLHQHADDVADLLIHRDHQAAVREGDVGLIAQIGDAALRAVPLDEIVLLQRQGRALIQHEVLGVVVIQDVGQVIQPIHARIDDVSRRAGSGADDRILQVDRLFLGRADIAVDIGNVFGQRGRARDRAGSALLQDEDIVLLIRCALLDNFGTGVIDRGHDPLGVRRSGLVDRLGGNDLAVDAPREREQRAVGTVALDQDRDRVVQTVVGTADRVVAGDAVVVRAEAVILQIRVHLIDDEIRGDVRDLGIVVQARCARDLEVIELEFFRIVVVVAHLREEELMVVNDDMRVEFVVGVMQHGDLLRGDRHVVAVHVDAVVVAAPEQESTFDVDTRDHHDVNAVEDVLAVLAAELLDHDQRALAGRRLIRMDLGLLPDDGQAAVLQDLGSFVHGGIRRDVLLREDDQRIVVVVVRRRSRTVDVHVGTIRSVLRDEVHHLLLGRGLIHRAALAKRRRGERHVVSQAVRPHQVLHLVRAFDRHHMLDALIEAFRYGLAVRTDRIVVAGLEAAASARAGLDRYVLHTGGKVILGDDEKFNDVVVLSGFPAAYQIAVAVRFCNCVTSIIVGFDYVECRETRIRRLGEDSDHVLNVSRRILLSPLRNAVKHRDDDILRRNVFRIVKDNLEAAFCCKRRGNQQAGNHRKRQQQADYPISGLLQQN